MSSIPSQPWRSTFDFFDLDRSGTISISELRQCLESFGQKATEEEVRDMLRAADADGSDEVDYDEFVKLMTHHGSAKIDRAALHRYFGALDKDGSGYITCAELRHAYTKLGHGLTDEEMDMIMDRYDADGNGQMTFDEFVEFVIDGHGIEVELDEDVYRSEEPEKQEEPAFAPPPRKVEEEKAEEEKGFFVEVADPSALTELLKPLADGKGQVRKLDVQTAMDYWAKHRGVQSVDPDSDPALHWPKDRSKHGVGEVIYKCNHISIVVSDVGRSVDFYSNVIGLEQIRRPDFDRHGAWFTMGNMELHLAKGDPVVPTGNDLVLPHIAIETIDIDRVPIILQRCGVPFRQNVAVPKGKVAAGTNTSDGESKAVKQYFVRDPDGYFIEICNCDLLTKYCLGDLDELDGYDHGVALNLQEAAMFVNLADKLAHSAERMHRELEAVCEEMHDRPLEEIAERLGCKQPAEQVDQEKLEKLLKRRNVYTDICQNESEESIKEILMRANNHVPTAIKIMEVRGYGERNVQAPAFFDGGKDRVKPKARMSKTLSQSSMSMVLSEGNRAEAPKEQPWRSTFDFFDLDRSGTISVSELRQCLESFGQKATEEHVRQMLREADCDGSDEVDYDEFVKLMTCHGSPKIDRAALHRYFSALDKDGSGYITCAELRHAYTKLGHGLTDEEMDMIMDRYDEDGNGQMTFDEFVDFVKDSHGLDVELDDDIDEPEEPEAQEPVSAPPAEKAKEKAEEPKPKEEEEHPDLFVDVKDAAAMAELLKPMAVADGKVRTLDLQSAMDYFVKHRGVQSLDPDSDPALHWPQGRTKNGIGEVIYKCNHVSIVVSDVGRAVDFYSNVMGLEQIRRPDFDRHGAWFTMGNMELHLAKGDPVVPTGNDLVLPHIAIETTNIDRVPGILQRCGVPFRQNVAVPKGKVKAGTNTSDGESKAVKQYFVRDPDGYFFEICNCELLTQYCLGDLEDLEGYDDHVALNLQDAAMFVNLADKLASGAERMHRELLQISEEMAGRPVKDIAERLGCKKRAEQADEEKLNRLLKRRNVYCDICQNESEEGIKEILLLADNHVPTAMKIMEIHGAKDREVRAPAYFEGGKDRVMPMTKRHSHTMLSTDSEK